MWQSGGVLEMAQHPKKEIRVMVDEEITTRSAVRSTWPCWAEPYCLLCAVILLSGVLYDFRDSLTPGVYTALTVIEACTIIGALGWLSRVLGRYDS